MLKHKDAIELSPVQQMQQEDHNRRHPGQVCGNCPVEVAHRARLRSTQERLIARAETDTGMEIAILIFIVAAVFLLLAVFA